MTLTLTSSPLPGLPDATVGQMVGGQQWDKLDSLLSATGSLCNPDRGADAMPRGPPPLR